MGTSEGAKRAWETRNRKQPYNPRTTPIHGHPYHGKTSDSLRYIMKDAHEAAIANPGGRSELKYLDQVNDAASVLGWRDRQGNPSLHSGDYARSASGGPQQETRAALDRTAAIAHEHTQVGHSHMSQGERERASLSGPAGLRMGEPVPLAKKAPGDMTHAEIKAELREVREGSMRYRALRTALT